MSNPNPLSLELDFGPSTSVGSFNITKIRGVYSGTSLVKDAIIWNGLLTTVGNQGLFTANLTSDGTATGPALYAEIYSVSTIHILNTTTVGSGCFAIVRSFGAGLKTALFLGCNGGNAAAAGSTFYVTVIGRGA